MSITHSDVCDVTTLPGTYKVLRKCSPAKQQKVRGVVKWQRQRAVVGPTTFRMSRLQPTVVRAQHTLFWPEPETGDRPCIQSTSVLSVSRTCRPGPTDVCSRRPPSSDETFLVWSRPSLGILCTPGPHGLSPLLPELASRKVQSDLHFS